MIQGCLGWDRDIKLASDPCIVSYALGDLYQDGSGICTVVGVGSMYRFVSIMRCANSIVIGVNHILWERLRVSVTNSRYEFSDW